MKRLTFFKRLGSGGLLLLQTLFTLGIAFRHIAGENLKVLSAALRRVSWRGRALTVVFKDWLFTHKLSVSFYSLLVTAGLKGLALFGLLPFGLSAYLPLIHSLDVILLGALGAFVYLFRAVVFSLIKMEHQKDAAILNDGVDFHQLLALRHAIESSPEAFALWDKNQKMVLSNSKFKDIYNLNDLKGSDALSYQQFGAQVNRLMMRPRRLNKGFEAATYQAQLCNGHWLNIQERPTPDGGQLCVSFDVTNLKTVQQNLMIREKQMCTSVENLRESRRELEQKTQKLAELADKLRQEKDRAEDANRVKAEFLANISHELRTPLNAILGFSDMMQREVLGPIGNVQYMAYVNDIHMSGAYLLELINDILDMSRIEAGRMKLERKHCSLNQLLQDCLNLVSPQAHERDISISADFAEEIHFMVDQRAIKQVILNLMSNAIKFTQKNGHVSLSAKRTSDYVELIVQDNGIGIDPAQIANLCKPFAQIENQMTKSHPGTGLGLAISRSIVDLHGGALSIESEIGVGTRVVVSLPIHAPFQDQSDKDKKPRLATIAA